MLRFGIHSGQQYTDFPSYLALFREVEELGLDWASVFDHFLPIQCNPEGPCYDGLTALAGLAAGTSKITCGILVTGVTYRNPAMLAKIAVTLDHLSGGRFELGMGAAWYELEHNQYGIPFPAVKDRMDMLEEAVPIVKSLFTQKHTTFEGKHFQLKDALSEPKPLKKIPIWIGGGGEQRTLRVTARFADGWNYFLGPVEEYQHKLDVLAKHCTDCGRDPQEIRKSVVCQAVLRETRSQAQEAAEQRARKLGDKAAPLPEAAVVGTPEDLIERLRPFVKMGVGDFLVLARPPADPVTLELFATRVAPALRP